MAIKVDVIKAFDILNWNFLLKVFSCFGFSSKFIEWISKILFSAHLFVIVNGKLHGYFSCARGVCQGDPLSLLLFCLAEEVLRRGISNLVSYGRIKPMRGVRFFNFLMESWPLRRLTTTKASLFLLLFGPLLPVTVTFCLRNLCLFGGCITVIFLHMSNSFAGV